MARILQRHSQATLMLGAGASLAARLNLGALRDVATQASNIFIINLTHVIDAEGADLAARAEITSAATAKTRAAKTIRSIWAI